jgi:hypothetical protein
MKTRLISIIIACALWIAVLPVATVTTGCNQNTVAALVNTLGTSAASIASLEGDTALSTKLQTDTAAAVSAVTNWKTGTPAQTAIEAITLVEDDLNLFPLNTSYEPLIVLALGTAASIIAILNPGAVSARISQRRSVSLSNPPKTSKQYKAQWNAICAQNPALAGAVL